MLFPEGIGKIGDYDDRERERKELLEVAKNVLLNSIKLYILDLESKNLLEQNSPITGATISFTAEKLAELGMKDKEGNALLNEDDVLEVLGVDGCSLEAQKEPIGITSLDGKFKFYRYTTKEPTLRFIKQINVSEPHSVPKCYFQITEEELMNIAQEMEAEKEIRKNFTPRIPKIGEKEYENMSCLLYTSPSPRD